MGVALQEIVLKFHIGKKALLQCKVYVAEAIAPDVERYASETYFYVNRKVRLNSRLH